LSSAGKADSQYLPEYILKKKPDEDQLVIFKPSKVGNKTNPQA
jgi:hypothetical protein